MKHTELKCKDDCADPYCNTCNLFTCSVCRCSEGELPTDCPGHAVPYEERAAIYDGHIDYVATEGWVSK